jgi:2-amino-4-hydroxy-6-hydroxymethyldihydropteridine diphosphokinase
MSRLTDVYVGAGSNVEPEHNLARACAVIAQTWPGARFSHAYRNKAVGFDGPDFINMVVAFRAPESIEELLVKLRQIEEMCGRPRNSPKWASRAMDLDVLMFGSHIEKTADFTVPRPDLLKRPYMLGPMAEIGADVLHPTAGKTIGELWAEFDREAHAMVPANIDLPAAAV